MKKDEPTIFYLCDGKKDCNKNHCYKRIGNSKEACKYTADINHAKNFYKNSPAGTRETFREEDKEALQAKSTSVTQTLSEAHVKKQHKNKIKIVLKGEHKYKKKIRKMKQKTRELRNEIEQLNTALEKEAELLKKLR